MHLWRPWIAFCLLAAFAAGAAVIYKWTDADGVVHYSDQAVPGAEKMFTSSSSANGIGGAAHAVARKAADKAPPAHLEFSVFAIESPTKEQVFFGDDAVPVRLHLEPGLRPNQTIVWNLNGKQLEDQGPEAVAFALQKLPRGAYSIAATVADSVTGESQTTESIVFYVRQPSKLEPLHKKP